MPSELLLHHTTVTAPGAQPSRYLLVLHGILGSGGNFRSFVRRLSAARPEWGFVLVDLREHGQSLGAPPPHTLAAAAGDLVRLEASLGLPVSGVMGHSFGGKVALAFTQARQSEGGGELDEAWILDASPGTRRDRSGMTERVLGMLRSIEWPLPSRESFLHIAGEHGFSPAIAEWLAMNVRRASDEKNEGVTLRLDLDAIGAMLEDYFSVDLWPALEAAHGARSFHVVVAGDSDAYDAADRARLSAIAGKNPRVHAHLVEGAGHWVHVDKPDALFELLRRNLA